jgi:hypothetical protein
MSPGNAGRCLNPCRPQLPIRCVEERGGFKKAFDYDNPATQPNGGNQGKDLDRSDTDAGISEGKFFADQRENRVDALALDPNPQPGVGLQLQLAVAHRGGIDLLNPHLGPQPTISFSAFGILGWWVDLGNATADCAVQRVSMIRWDSRAT